MKSKGLIRKAVAVVSTLAMVLSMIPSTASEAAPLAKISKTKLTLTVGTAKTLKVTAKKFKGITWKSTKARVASVSKKTKNTAKVTAKKKGTATIKATVKITNKKKKVLSCKVTVKEAAPKATDAPVVTTAPTAVLAVPTQNPTAKPAITATNVPVVTAEPTAAGPTEVPTETPVPELDKNNLATVDYPVIFADIPDTDVIRVGGNYYMVSTTMNMCPGVPIMKSTDLAHWRLIGYVYDTYEDDDIMNLENGKNTYRHGSWAASLKYDEASKLYYCAFNSNDHGRFYIYTTDDIENGTWTKYTHQGMFHDPGILVEDGKIYVANGGNLTELALNESDNTISNVGASKKIISQPSNWSLWEGTHLYHIGDYYYVMMIASPTSGWFRTEVCYRSKDLQSTDWEEQVVYSGSTYEYGTGLAQGGIFDTIYNEWYGMMFQDHDGAGRIPSVVAVNWDYTDADGNNYKDWPMMGTYDSDGNFVANKADAPMKINLNDSGEENYFCGDDDFDYAEGEKLQLAWQWNHNPHNDYWSLTDNPGYMRLTTDTTVDNICFAHNSLTQKLYGPKCTSEIKLNTDNLKNGDYAGLCAVSDNYAMIGVMCDDNGDRYVFQANATFLQNFSAPNAKGDKIEKGQDVYLKAEYVFKDGKNRVDTVDFYYSLDGSSWTKLGKQMKMNFSTSTTFMGARSWLFNYATQEAGGYADFDYYKIY